jgi:sugar phosphate isomerase/epimerase
MFANRMIGIIQGRLTQYKNRNILQKFPKNYQKEFFIAKELGYDFIEIFSERIFNKSNPIWTKNGLNNYLKASRINKVKLYSFCYDEIISNSIEKKQIQKKILKLINHLSFLKIKKFIFPLYGKSSINKNNFNNLSRILKYICFKCKKKKIDFIIETNCTYDFFMKIKKNIKYKNFYLCFDTGNRAANFKMYEDIARFGKLIGHIHLKDKNIIGKNVKFNSGIVDFNKIFKVLKKIKYKKSFSIESVRGKNPIFTAKKNIKYFKRKIKNL